MTTDDLRYPIGKYSTPQNITASDREKFLAIIHELPKKMNDAVNGLNDAQLDTPYRENGWTLRQVVHHVVDSHVNAYIRFKFALTEDNPTIKPYNENLWAELPEAKTGAVEISLPFIDAIHKRWVVMMKSMSEDQWARTYIHPEKKVTSRLDEVLSLYAWHSEHHTAHITSLRKRMNW